ASDGAATIGYLVVEAGAWRLPNGALLEVGTVTTSATLVRDLSNEWTHVSFSGGFEAIGTPVILSQVQSGNDLAWVRTRQRNASATGFDMALEENEVSAGAHLNETIGWLAIQPSRGEWSGHSLVAATTGETVDHEWSAFAVDLDSPSSLFMASLATHNDADPAGLRFQRLGTTGVEIRVKEDTTWDDEIDHSTEVVNYLMIGGIGELSATKQ
ncbi:MAG: peptidase, partial [bacterium]|nr:peptidase [bacterium]